MSYIELNIDEVNENIRIACEKSGRKKEEVTLIVVSKTIDVERIKVAVEKGENVLGENRVQEIMDKYSELENVNWHLIGHLQTNKVKYIIDKVQYIHSVESIKLAEEISKKAVSKNVNMNILIEVNVAEEESKFGVKVCEVESLITKISKLPNITVKGLMTVAPFVENPEENRVYFRKMKELLVDINRKKIDNINMTELSMGMTGDYIVAIEEGATMVRVGTGIFGKRNYSV